VKSRPTMATHATRHGQTCLGVSMTGLRQAINRLLQRLKKKEKIENEKLQTFSLISCTLMSKEWNAPTFWALRYDLDDFWVQSRSLPQGSCLLMLDLLSEPHL